MEERKQDILEEASANYEKGLVQKVKRSKDREAFHALVKLHSGLAFSAAFRILGNREDALEAAQDAFVKSFTKIRQYRGEVPFKYWLRKITVNTSLNRLRSRKSDCLSNAGEILDDVSQDKRKLTSGPEELVEAHERDRQVRNALMRLDDPFRTVIVLRDIEGYKYEEIARMSGVSVGTVKSRISRGRQELRQMLAGKQPGVKEYEL